MNDRKDEPFPATPAASSPAESGSEMASSHEIDTFLQREIDCGSFPAAVYAIGSRDGIFCEGALGNAVAVPVRIRATHDTIFDIASITKCLITTTLVLQCVAENALSLDEIGDEIGDLPVTVRQLLTHTSGLRPWIPLYAGNDPLRAIVEQGPADAPGSQVVYSDLNFFLLYFLLRRLRGDYPSLARSRIFEPLGLRDSFFSPPASLRSRIAATEWGQRFESGMCADRGIAVSGLRTGLMWGEPNDGNSFHMGGAAGNAGLFATARDVCRIMQGWVRREILPEALVREATRDQTIGMNESRGLGWLLPRGESNASRMLSPGSFGHTGFTGTSAWYDLASDTIMVLLTNRVHPCASPVAMQKIRGEFHSLALSEPRPANSQPFPTGPRRDAPDRTAPIPS